MRRNTTRRRTRAKGEEGMALLLVIILIVMVSAAGVFASQSTALEVRTSGYVRQSAQTHYVSESGVIASLDRMRAECRAYRQVIDQQAAMRVSNPNYAEQLRTYRFYLDDFIPLTLPGANGLFAAPTAGMGGTRVEGSFGTGGLSPGFVTTVRIVGRSTQPLVGFDIGGGRNYSPEIDTLEFSADGLTRLQALASMPTVTGNPLTGGNTEARLLARVLSQVPCI